jgi:hypothetical protein
LLWRHDEGLEMRGADPRTWPGCVQSVAPLAWGRCGFRVRSGDEGSGFPRAAGLRSIRPPARVGTLRVPRSGWKRGRAGILLRRRVQMLAPGSGRPSTSSASFSREE